MNSKVERMAELAMKLGAKNLADYGSIKSRHDFTQRQLMACLILRIYLKTTYRGFIDLLEGHTGLREVLGMTTKLPHYTTLQKFSARRDVLAVAEAMIAQMGQAALRQAGPETEVAADATGLEMTNASAHFTSRAGRVRRKWKKVSVLVVCGLLMPLGMVVADGPGSDKTQAEELLHKGFTTAEEAGVLPAKLFADAGYDADWIHGVCRRGLGSAKLDQTCDVSKRWELGRLLPTWNDRTKAQEGRLWKALERRDILQWSQAGHGLHAQRPQGCQSGQGSGPASADLRHPSLEIRAS